MILQQNIRIDQEKIAAFCRRNHIQSLALFGSVLRNDFRPDSDVDVLVEFEPGKTPGFDFVRMQDELSGIIGRPVDLLTIGFISRYIRDRVQREARVIYGPH
jgi:predicted nucleotidyltransferase